MAIQLILVKTEGTGVPNSLTSFTFEINGNDCATSNWNGSNGNPQVSCTDGLFDAFSGNGSWIAKSDDDVHTYGSGSGLEVGNIFVVNANGAAGQTVFVDTIKISLTTPGLEFAPMILRINCTNPVRVSNGDIFGGITLNSFTTV